MEDGVMFRGSVFYEMGMACDTAEERAELWQAIMEYGMYGKEPPQKFKRDFVNIRFILEKNKSIRLKRIEAGKSHKGNQYTKGDEKRKGKEEAQKNPVEQNGTQWNTMEQVGTNGTNKNKKENKNINNINNTGKKEDNKLSSKEKEFPSVSDLVGAYQKNDALMGKIKNIAVVRLRAEYKQKKKDRAYKTITGFIQQLAVMVKTVENKMPRTDVAMRLQFAINQAQENERKGIVWNDRIEQEFESFKKFNSMQGTNKP